MPSHAISRNVLTCRVRLSPSQQNVILSHLILSHLILSSGSIVTIRQYSDGLCSRALNGTESATVSLGQCDTNGTIWRLVGTNLPTLSPSPAGYIPTPTPTPTPTRTPNGLTGYLIFATYSDAACTSVILATASLLNSCIKYESRGALNGYLKITANATAYTETFYSDKECTAGRFSSTVEYSGRCTGLSSMYISSDSVPPSSSALVSSRYCT